MTEIIDKEFIIPSHLHGKRLDAAVSELLPEYSRSRITQWIKDQSVQVNQKFYKPSDKVQQGDLIKLNASLISSDPDFKTSQAEQIALSIVYEDEHILIINKQAGLVVHPGAGNPSGTLINALLNHNPDQINLPRAGIVHRLDKDTTGLMVIAKKLEAQTQLVKQMQAREIHRFYMTLVQGEVHSSGEITTQFGRHPRNRLKMAVKSQGVNAITHYRIQQKYRGMTLLLVQLETGRTHQIRVHMEHIHHPVVGDPLYGRLVPKLNRYSKSVIDLLTTFKRQALHAWKLELQHPVTREELTFTAEMPDDLKELLIALEKDYHETTEG